MSRFEQKTLLAGNARLNYCIEEMRTAKTKEIQYREIIRQTKLKECQALPALLTFFFYILQFASCSNDDIIQQSPQSFPISFHSSHAEEHVVARAASPLNHDFCVWGYKTQQSSTQGVFKGYQVAYTASSAGTTIDNTHNYSYLDAANNQFIKFWDFSADEYNFWGYTGDLSDFQADGGGNVDGTMLVISDLEQAIAEPDLSLQLFSSLYHRAPVTSDVVQLQFKRPMSQVSLLFYAGEELAEGDEVEIGSIAFRPQAPQEIVAEGSLTVTYSQHGAAAETYATTPSASVAELTFDDVTLDYAHGTATNTAVAAVPSGGTPGEHVCYYAVPYAYEVPFILTLTIDGTPATAQLPAQMMHWLPGYAYTYVFKIMETGKKIEIHDVKIDPWVYGGSQDEEWKNW